MKLNSSLRKAVGLGAIAAATILPTKHVDGAILVTYTADQSGIVTKPVYGLSSTDSNFFLSGRIETDSLSKNFTGNNQESYVFVNPTLTKDAASFNNDYMFQLGADNTIRQVRLSDGARININDKIGIETGNNTFGIGYDAGTNTIGIGQFDGSQMSFRTYDVGTGLLSDPISFAFNAAQYGTPTGLDYVVKGGSPRMLVGTRDGPPETIFESDPRNFVLDMDADSGLVGQYATIMGSTNKLQDLLYDNGRLVTSFERAGAGYIQVGDFTVIPEPKAMGLAAGLAALGAAAYMRNSRRRERPVKDLESSVNTLDAYK
ncbi:MAG: hypothetical protein ACMXYF_02530 [Candidatus Woesearchaeota archaeon]